jgi:mRNA interferase RelE/StbE
MSGTPYYRLRVGDYRVIIDWQKDDSLLFVRKIGHRRNIYDR